jgi:enamine deaminase RidA (YjgF/YER057c/UK114 family)
MTNNLDLNKFNSFINAAAETIACGPECQEQKKADELKNKYMMSEANLALAEPEYQIAKQNYYTYVSGQSGYDEMMEVEYTEKAELITKNFKESYSDEIAKIKSQLDTYNSLLVNSRNVADLYTQYKKENIQLFEQLKNETNDVLTNERKTYYEDQEIDTLNGYYLYFFWIIYIIALICFAIFSLIYPSHITLTIRVLLLFVFILLPFVSTWILGKIIQLVYFLFTFVPKNVYK